MSNSIENFLQNFVPKRKGRFYNNDKECISDYLTEEVFVDSCHGKK